MHILASLRSKYREIISAVAASRLAPQRVRRHVLKSLGWKIGESSHVWWGVIPTASNVEIGENCVISHNSFFDGGGSVVVEDFVRMGPFCKVLTTTHPIEKSERRRIAGRDFNLETSIEYGAWLGTGVMLLPGVRVARGCVIAAGAVVVSSTEPNGLYAGVPARRIKDLAIE